ncbi:DUF3311 domain-containing protein [Sulfuracidifex tepidarius]|uniref:DUF3311 domain-containing protein n=1 Tax=Sulfuracidifex tepidarius TaxID=1294262 RepID=A0A510DRU8_9CREN|nr:DUF3311 domain-containing protein [Sulfuracidifex tepidarius]BBG22888.1 hypothetical protein IC006_0172 [Sulfuracidifex tepidarius]BBG25649.1 hypothetical protein IC007_0154 [Sulfuracidifex tepidarius]
MSGNKYYVGILVMFIIDIILYAVLPVFDKVSPAIGGLPFFYTYQTIMLVVSSILFLIPSLAGDKK